MKLTAQIAKQIRDLHFGGNWTASSVKDSLAGISWQQAVTRVHSCNTIASLVFHMNYYVSAVLEVLQGELLNASDKLSFNHAPILSADDWEKLLDKTWRDAESFATLVEQLPEAKLREDFSDNKYGSWFRNLEGVIEHIHYHLGQIVLIIKIIQEDNRNK